MKLKIQVDTAEAEALSDRARRLTPSARPSAADGMTSAVQFLRGVMSKATLTLPAFYLFLATSENEPANSVPAFAGKVLTHWIRYSSRDSLSLACRSVFDDAKTGLTGGKFGKISDATLEHVATYWSEGSGESVNDARAALVLLRKVFRACSAGNATLLRGTSTLGKRIGLLKQHADRTAAHLTLENFEFSIADCAHVVGALTLIGEIIRTFDAAREGREYFSALDEAAHSAAKAMFPTMPNLRLFHDMDVATQALWCWKHQPQKGEHMLLEQLPQAIGWY